MNPTGRQLHDHEEIEGDQAILGPNLDGGKVHTGQYLPVALRKVCHVVCRLRWGACSMPCSFKMLATLVAEIS